MTLAQPVLNQQRVPVATDQPSPAAGAKLEGSDVCPIHAGAKEEAAAAIRAEASTSLASLTAASPGKQPGTQKAMGTQMQSAPGLLDQAELSDLQNYLNSSVNGEYGDNRLTCEVLESGECIVVLESLSHGVKRGLTGRQAGNSSMSFAVTDEGSTVDEIKEKLETFLGENNKHAAATLFNADGRLENTSNLLSKALDARTDVKLLDVQNVLIKDAKWMHANISGAVFTNVVMDSVDLFDAQAKGTIFQDCKAREVILDEADMSGCTIDRDSDFSKCRGINANFEGSRIEGLMKKFNAAGANINDVKWRTFTSLRDVAAQCGGMIFDEKQCNNALLVKSGKKIAHSKAFQDRYDADTALTDLHAHTIVPTETKNGKAVQVDIGGLDLMLEKVAGDPYKLVLTAMPGYDTVEIDDEKKAYLKQIYDQINQSPRPLEAAEVIRIVFKLLDGVEVNELNLPQLDISQGGNRIVMN